MSIRNRLLIAGAAVAVLFLRMRAPPAGGFVHGSVSGPTGAIAGATVRWQGHPDAVITDRHGEFSLPVAAGHARIAASAEGHFIATSIPPPHAPAHIILEPLPVNDDPSYAWVDPSPCSTSPGNCGTCHERIHSEWERSAHARAATNPRLRDLIEGTDADGLPEPEWHMRRDHPHGVAVCNACHAPTLEPTDPHWESLTSSSGVAAAGVHCDFCHKVRSVDTANVGLTHGRYALGLLRPADGRQVVFGRLDDAERADTAAAAFYGRSEYCASCHEGTVFGVEAYTTYGEWQSSPAGLAGRQCQDCHMQAAADVVNMAPGHGGIDRDPATLSDHSFAGAASPRYEHSLALTLDAHATPRGIEATVTLDAARVGHRVPTGFVDRHVVLLVDAIDGEGNEAAIVGGSRIPGHAGASIAGRAGALFAKVLTDPAGRMPAPMWLASETHADTRLDPDRPREIRFLVHEAASRLRIRLLHRDFWEATRRRKKWADDERILLDAEFDLQDLPAQARLLPKPAASPD